MTGRGAARGAARGGAPAGRGRGASAAGGMVPQVPQAYGAEGYDYVRSSKDFFVVISQCNGLHIIL